MHQDIKKILFTEEQIVQKSKELGQMISNDYRNKKPLLVGLLKGCVPFLAELIKHITIPMEFDFLSVSSYDGTNSTGQIKIKADLSADISNRDIIIVEDIIDTGLTLNDVLALLKSRGSKSVEVVTLLDKPEGRKVDNVVPKYIGFSVPNEFVVGFGLDYNQLYRNLPFIGVLKESVYSK